jgi:hypothetical protein
MLSEFDFENDFTNAPEGLGGLTMSPRFSSARARSGIPAQDQARPEPGHLVRVTILPHGLMALLLGLVLAAISLVQDPEQQEPTSLTHVILRGHTDQVNAVA